MSLAQELLVPGLVGIALAGGYALARPVLKYNEETRKFWRDHEARAQKLISDTKSDLPKTIEAFKREYAMTWQFHSNGFIMIDGAGDKLRIAWIGMVDGVVGVVNDYVISTDKITSTEVVINDDVVLSSASIIETPGGLGRALVGGAIAGPAGAIVGAATARRTVQTTTQQKTVQKQGRLVIRVDDIANPIVEISSQYHANLYEWLHRIRAAVASRVFDQGRPGAPMVGDGSPTSAFP